MSPRTLVISTTYKTRVALEKPCKKRLGILSGQLTDTGVSKAHQARRVSRYRVSPLPNLRRSSPVVPTSGGCQASKHAVQSRVGRRENSFTSRRHRDHLERVRRLGDGRQAAHSATHGGFCEAAGRGGKLKIGSGLAAKRIRYHSITLRDPYLTQILFADFPEAQEKNGSSGRTRTYNRPVNSRI
jgi:hypothetical protein